MIRLREYDRYKELKCIVNTEARISSEQVRVRRVRERLYRVHALIYPGVASQGGDPRRRASKWGCHLGGDAILGRWRQFNDKKSTRMNRDLHRRRW